MRWRLSWRRPILTVSQVLILVAVLIGLYVALDLNRRAQEGRLVGVGEGPLREELTAEMTRQVELQATLSFVQSDAYVSQYAREEAGMILPGEKKVVPLLVEATPAPASAAEPTPDPASYARPWQAWWQLLTDAPLPTR